MYDLIIRDATIVSSTGRVVADVAISDGRIAYVGPRPPHRAEKEISAIGKFLMPGVIDTAVQFDPNCDPGLWDQESRAAITGGVTTVIALPGGERPVVDRATAKRRIKLAHKRSWCNYALWGAAHDGNAAELAQAVEDGLIAGTLAYVDDVDVGASQGLSVPAARLSEFFPGGGVLCVQLAVSGHGPGRVVDQLRTVDRPVHLVHLSTAVELDLIDPVRGDLPVTAGVTPHHLFLCAEEELRVQTRPPVRPEHDRRTLWTAVKRGRLDCVASDHHPTVAPGGDGVPGTELLFPLMLSAVRYGRLSLELLVSLCSESPARIFGLEGKGRIARGADADLILFSEGEATRVTEMDLKSTAGWSPYADREAAPKPELVLVHGEIVARRGQIVADGPSGTCITAH